MTVYLLHFSVPYRGAGHYVGWCKDDQPDRRLQEHLDGNGNPLVHVASKKADVLLARVWPGQGRGFERWLKQLKGIGKRACPICLGRTPAGRTNGYEPPLKENCVRCKKPVTCGTFCDDCWKVYRKEKQDARQ